MLNLALLKKYVRESLLLWTAVAIALFIFSWFRVWIVSEVDTARFQQILDLLPEDWRRFSSVDFEWLISYLGRTSLTLDEPMIMMLVGVWAIVRGSDVVSGELNRGTMEMVLAQPVSRSRIFSQHAALTVFGLLLLVLLVLLGMTGAVYTTTIVETTYPTVRVPLTRIGIPVTVFGPTTETVPLRELVRPIQFLPGIINLFCFGSFIAACSMMFSAWDRFRWRTLGIVVGIYFAGALIKFAALASDSFAWLQWLTFFTLYEPAMAIETVESTPGQAWYLLHYTEQGLTEGLGPLGMNGVLVGLAILFFGIGSYVFRNRDLPAPL